LASKINALIAKDCGNMRGSVVSTLRKYHGVGLRRSRIQSFGYLGTKPIAAEAHP
jgi:hypothetical protein